MNFELIIPEMSGVESGLSVVVFFIGNIVFLVFLTNTF